VRAKYFDNLMNSATVRLRRLYPSIRRLSIAAGVFAAIGTSAVLLLLGIVQLLNWDIGGRSSEMREAPPLSESHHPSDSAPMLVLTIHRILYDENAVEMSADLRLSDSLIDDLRKRNISYLTAEVRDASGLGDVYLANTVRVDVASLRPGVSATSAQSQRFQVPFVPSIATFPFDRTIVTVIPEVYDSEDSLIDNKTEVLSMIPGRRMTFPASYGNLQIDLSRSPLQDIFVVLSATVFFLLSIAIVIVILSSRDRLSGAEGIVAVAGFVLASSGFRDLLEVPKWTGTSFLEIVTFGIPFSLLTLAVLISLARSRMSATRDGSVETVSNGK